MAEHHQNEKLNQLLIDILRGVVQYAAECWPWTSNNDAVDERDAVAAIQQSQRQHVRRIADLLSERDWAVDLGTYPTEYTSLHYVSLEYLFNLLVTGEASLVAELEDSRKTFADDAAAAQLLDEILAAERGHLQTLRKLSEAHVSARAAVNEPS